MGYRNYLCLLKKEDFKEGKSYFEYGDELKTLHELGKYVEGELIDKFTVIYNLDDEDTEFKIIDIESVLHIIEHYSKKQLSFLQSVKNGENQLFDAQKLLDNQIREWATPQALIFNIDKKDDSLVNSWSFQYVIFDLIRIYKTFDVEKHYLVWTGH